MPRLAYLLAASHSGSTLLAMLLGAQPGACTAGELKASHLGDADTYRCSCRERIRDCAFWQEIGRAMKRRGILDFSITSAGTSVFEAKGPHVQRLLSPLYRGKAMETVRDLALALCKEWRTLLATSTQRNMALIESLLEVTGAGVVIDSSKVALRLKYLLPIPGLDIRVIRVIRDGRAVSLTYTDEWNFADSSDPALRGGGSGQQRPPPRRSMAKPPMSGNAATKPPTLWWPPCRGANGLKSATRTSAPILRPPSSDSPASSISTRKQRGSTSAPSPSTSSATACAWIRPRKSVSTNAGKGHSATRT